MREKLLQGFKKVRTGKRATGESEPCACSVAVMEGVVEGSVMCVVVRMMIVDGSIKIV